MIIRGGTWALYKGERVWVSNAKPNEDKALITIPPDYIEWVKYSDLRSCEKMNLYKVRVSAVYCVDSDNETGAGLKALGVMREEIIRCPENLNDFKTEVTLISESA